MKRTILFAILIAAAFAQNPAAPAPSAQPQTASPTTSADRSEVQRLQFQIDNLRSMLNAMGSQINTVHDSATQQALRTNEQMWMLAINDMQARVNRMQQR